ncbi:MAG: hypothetical protein IT422_08415 [Pirellulaceae bacterium]|jgi:hypothetical protein|nr:hypothetical protein [Pirellulaceae bacterium]
MKSDIQLRSDAMQLLRKQLGLVESERFIALIARETFDYTRWRQNQWTDATVAELAEQSRQLRRKAIDEGKQEDRRR